MRLIVDHCCHAHGLVRGWTCESCNQSLWREERRHTMAELLTGVCVGHCHRTEHRRERCWAAWRKASARRIEHYRRCPAWDALSPVAEFMQILPSEPLEHEPHVLTHHH